MGQVQENESAGTGRWNPQYSGEHTFFELMLAEYKKMGAYAIEISLVDGTKFKLLLEDLYIYLGSHVYIPGFAGQSKDTPQGKVFYYKPDRYYYYNQAKEKKVIQETNFISIIKEEIKDFKTGRDFRSNYEFPEDKDIYSFMIKNFYPNRNTIYKKWSETVCKVIDSFVMVNKAVFQIEGRDDYCDYDISIDAKVPVRSIENNFCFNLDCIVSIKPYADPLIDVRRITDSDFLKAAMEHENSHAEQ